MIQVPVTNRPNQTFRMTIPRAGVANISLEFKFWWNRIANYWQMTVKDASTDTPLIDGLSLLLSDAPGQNILRQYTYLNIGQAYLIPISPQASDRPQLGDWDTNFILLWSA